MNAFETPLQKSAADRPLRLLIVDDQPVIRRGLALMLGSEPDLEVVAQAADGEEAVRMAATMMPDVVVMDLQMPRKSGVAATREIRMARPDARVVVLTTYDDDELVFEALRAGAQAYLLKDASEAEIRETIHAAYRGESHLSPSIARKLIDQFRRTNSHTADIHEPSVAPDPMPQAPSADPADAMSTAAMNRGLEEPLTAKEQRVLELIGQGRSNKQIASTIFLAEGTVKNYVSRIMDKLHAHSRIELAVRTVRAGERRP
ncbi:MAG: response regulator transcription factor [Burkholderiaceae bacterium]